MSLYKRGKVYWSALWVDGVRQMRSLETSNRRRAELLEQALRQELHARRFQLPQFKPEMTFGELYTRFLAEGEVKAYHLERSKLFLPFFSEMEIGQITRNDIIRSVNTATRNILPNRRRTRQNRSLRPPQPGHRSHPPSALLGSR